MIVILGCVVCVAQLGQMVEILHRVESLRSLYLINYSNCMVCTLVR